MSLSDIPAEAWGALGVLGTILTAVVTWRAKVAIDRGRTARAQARAAADRDVAESQRDTAAEAARATVRVAEIEVEERISAKLLDRIEKLELHRDECSNELAEMRERQAQQIAELRAEHEAQRRTDSAACAQELRALRHEHDVEIEGLRRHIADRDRAMSRLLDRQIRDPEDWSSTPTAIRDIKDLRTKLRKPPRRQTPIRPPPPTPRDGEGWEALRPVSEREEPTDG